MKSVMLSIQPKWTELIANGKKTVEVRKTKPKIDVPFKCYIYCTKGEHLWKRKDKVFLDGAYNRVIDDLPDYLLDGKVIGEFVCDKIVEFENSWYDPAFAETSELSCVGWEELALYLGGKDIGYGWHIIDLVIYEQPKELSEFYVWKKCNSCRDSGYESTACCYDEDCKVPAVITRPPQSWCYCEEILPPLVEPKGKTITIPRWRYNEHKGETE